MNDCKVCDALKVEMEKLVKMNNGYREQISKEREEWKDREYKLMEEIRRIKVGGSK